MEPIFDAAERCAECVRELRNAAPGRFAYFAAFHPDGDAGHVERLRESLRDPGCIGIKIHPTVHKVDADDDRFAPAFGLAQEFGKPIMTHSWEISSYNPEQYRSHPDRFRRHLTNFRELPFVLGHAGGRPSAFAAVGALCDEFPNVVVDLAGDYYESGLIDALAARIGANRVLFGSDVDWMDPRCNLGPVLASQLPDRDLLSVLRNNALRVYGEER